MSIAPVSLTRLSPQDLAKVTSWEQSPDASAFIAAQDAETHAASLRLPNHHYLLIRSDGRDVGFIVAVAAKESLELRRIVVALPGHGIGKAAIRALEHWAGSELKMNSIWLDVFEDNVRARHVYNQAGFVEFGRNDLNGRPLCLMHKRLDSASIPSCKTGA